MLKRDNDRGNRVGGPTELNVGTPRIVYEENDVEKPKGEPTPVHRLGTPGMAIDL